MWKEWQDRQHEIISRVAKNGRGGRSGSKGAVRNSFTGGDSSPGSVFTAADTPFTPFSGTVSDTDGGERVQDNEPADVGKGHMRMTGSATKHVPFSNLSRRAIKEAKLKRNLDRRLRRMGVGRSKKGTRSYTVGSSSKDRDIDKSSVVSNVLLKGLARPCSYCHVPYHHRLAPFTNMKLVPCVL